MKGRRRDGEGNERKRRKGKKRKSEEEEKRRREGNEGNEVKGKEENSMPEREWKDILDKLTAPVRRKKEPTNQWEDKRKGGRNDGESK